MAPTRWQCFVCQCTTSWCEHRSVDSFWMLAIYSTFDECKWNGRIIAARWPSTADHTMQYTVMCWMQATPVPNKPDRMPKRCPYQMVAKTTAANSFSIRPLWRTLWCIHKTVWWHSWRSLRFESTHRTAWCAPFCLANPECDIPLVRHAFSDECHSAQQRGDSISNSIRQWQWLYWKLQQQKHSTWIEKKPKQINYLDVPVYW